MVLKGCPTTPGGLGIVEGLLIPALVTLGALAAVALLGVLTWRLVQFWLPIPVALGMDLSLRLHLAAPAPRQHSDRGSKVLRRQDVHR